MRCLVLDREVVNQTLRVLSLVSDDACKLPRVMRVVGVEAVCNEVGVRIVFGKHNRLAQPVAACHLMAACHQQLHHLVHGVHVEQPLVHRLSTHLVRRVAFFIPIEFVPLRALVFAQLGVLDAFALKFEWHRYCARRHQVAFVNRIFQPIGIGRHAIFQAKQAVGIAIYLVFGCGRQAHQQRIKVSKDGFVFLVDGAMRLVHDDQIEMPYAKAAQPLVGFVDQAHHRGVG